jgi:DNA-binding MarR family transcriptional regulator
MARTIRFIEDINQEERQHRDSHHAKVLKETADQVISVLPHMVRAFKQMAYGGRGRDRARDLGVSQIVVLHMLLGGRQLTSELALRFNVTNPTMSRIIDGLVEKGFVQREIDPNDRRRVYLTLTETGAKIGRHKHGQERSALADFFSPLSEEQLKDIERAFGHIKSLLSEHGHEHSFFCPPSGRARRRR